MPHAAKRGVAMSSVEYSPTRKEQKKKAKEREEKRWAAKSGPVVTRRVDPASVKRGEKVELSAPSPAMSQRERRRTP